MATIETDKNIKATAEEPVEIELSISSPIYRGPQGPQGPEGPQGVPGCYIGTVAPAEDSGFSVWIDTAGDETELVNSINGQTGNIVLTAKDVGALPANTVIPTGYDTLSNLEITQIWQSI